MKYYSFSTQKKKNPQKKTKREKKEASILGYLNIFILKHEYFFKRKEKVAILLNILFFLFWNLFIVSENCWLTLQKFQESQVIGCKKRGKSNTPAYITYHLQSAWYSNHIAWLSMKMWNNLGACNLPLAINQSNSLIMSI